VGGGGGEWKRKMLARERSEHKDDARRRDERVAEGLEGARAKRAQLMPVCAISGSQEGWRGHERSERN
jgi:hypothetical protein